MSERPLRHAYLIMTHGSFQILEKQLRFLDSENADFFIHVDAKAGAFDFDKYRAIPQKSAVTFVHRISVEWGAYSMVRSEMELLTAASAGNYDYYHLLSGVDVPVKSREYIEEYFRSHNGINFILFTSTEITPVDLDRVRYYYPLQSFPFLERDRKNRLGRALVNRVQRKLHIDRTKNSGGLVFQKGAQWFSITDELAKYVLSQRKMIRKTFKCTSCADELFLQTIVINSPFKDTLSPNAFTNDHRSCCRYIDWSRGSPYTFRNGDYEELIRTDPDYLFARKFDYASDSEVVDRLFDYFGNTN